jgi:hypothetical protein
MVGSFFLEVNAWQAWLIYIGLCVIVFVLVLLLASLICRLHLEMSRKRAVSKAMKVTEGMGGNNASCLHGEELAPALKNKQIAFANFPLSEGSETLYTPPFEGSDPSLFIAGRTLVLAIPLEDYDEKIDETLNRLANGFDDALKLLYTKSLFYSNVVLIVANNAAEAARVKKPNARVVIGISGLIKELLRLARNPSPFKAEEGLNALYATFPDIRLLMKEDGEFDPRIVKGKEIIDKKDQEVPFDAKKDGDTIYTFHLYRGRALQKTRKEQ